MDLLAAIIVGLLSGSCGSLITTLLTPPIQHRFWKRQRRAELCLELSKRTAALIARFEEEWPRWKNELQPHQRDPGKTGVFYECVAIDAEVRVLFSEETWNEFANLKMIILAHSSITHDGGSFDLEEFAVARNAAMRALYSEIGLASSRANVSKS